MSKRPSAWIVSPKDNGRKSVKKIGSKDTVYLNDNEEFLIELFNPMKFCVLADIKLNGNSISNSGIVLNPGQRFYLDCNIDTGLKFKFKTYDVENTSEVMEAISDNGTMEVKFYRETVKAVKNWPYITSGTLTWNNDGFFNGYNTTRTTTNNVFYNNTTGIINTNSNPMDNLILCSATSIGSKSIETGRVEAGDASDQRFETINMDFDSWILSSIKIHILPESRKPIEAKKEKESNYNVIEMIQKLADLHNSGILTDEEFNSKKSELLARI